MKLLYSVATALAVLRVATEAKTSNQRDFPACPINHNPKQLCCEELNGNDKFILTGFNRPSDDPAYAEIFREGWKTPRQINYPDAKFTPDTPTFVYDSNSPDVCQLVSLDANEPQVLCSAENLSKAGNRDYLDGDQYWTFAKNPRNNNATDKCPEGYNTTENVAECKVFPIPATYLFHTYFEAPLVVVYLIYGLFALSLLLWTLFKRTYEQKVALKQQTRSDLESSAEKLLPETEDRQVEQIGYNNDTVGTCLLASFIFLTIGINLLTVIVIIDSYGLWPSNLFQPGERVLLVFIILWWITTFWLSGLVLLQSRIRNFFRLRSSLEECDYVYVFKPDQEEIALLDRSGVSQVVEKIENFCFPNHRRGHEQTLAVERTDRDTRTIEFQHVRYLYCPINRRFIQGAIALGETYHELQHQASGLSQASFYERLDSIGPNAITIEMPSMATSLVGEFFTLFYVYQIMCYYVWYQFSFYVLAIVMTISIIISAVINIVTKRRMQAAVVEMTKYSTTIPVCRDRQWINVPSEDIVPGDLIRVAENWVLPCDMVIVKGATVCDESMLTGESMPVQKFAIPEGSAGVYEPLGSGKKHTLFSGTKVLSSGRNEEILALVQTTGAHTSKGELVRNILFPIPMRFKYDEHMKVILLGLFVYAMVACYFVVDFLTSNGNLSNKLGAFIYCIFMISCILSPLFPVMVTIGQIKASNRLEELGVFSLNAQRITLCGKIRVFCFDKTGTLTKEGLDFLGCQSIAPDVTFNRVCSNVQDGSLSQEMDYALASCHALGSLDGELVGNQVEMKMFEGTGWKLIEQENQLPRVQSPDGQTQLQVVKRFEFDHHRMSMSVIMRNMKTEKLYIFCKGSYETMMQLSLSSSIPSNYSKQAQLLARDGHYVLAIGVRELPVLSPAELDQLTRDRDAVEQSLHMLGLILFRNELKPDTRQAIQELKKGDTRVVMITGDNAMCGAYIAKASDMVSEEAEVLFGDVKNDQLDWSNVETEERFTTAQITEMVNADRDIELAITGRAFRYLREEKEMAKLLLHTRIFSRMTPDDKVECVRMHMDTGAITGMCGDGGNDCGALRQAHAGIALSDAEASIVSPFTSKPKTITSVVDLCREGRCSVATSFASVKMLIMYGLVASTMRLVQYYNGVIMSEWCYILCDGFILVGLSYFITLSRPLPKLGDQRPTSSLIGPTTLASILGQEAINVFFLLTALNHLTSQPWYCPFSPDNVDMSKWWLLSDNAITTCLFFAIVFQQQAAAFVFSFGSKYREPVWQNKGLIAFYGALVALDLYLVLGEQSVIIDLFRIASSPNVVGLPDIPLPFSFRVEYLAFVVGNNIAVMAFEYFVILGPVRTYFRARFHKDMIPMKL